MKIKKVQIITQKMSFKLQEKKHAKEYKKTMMSFMKKTTIAWEWIG
jgi:hypothetical protein